MGFSRLTEDSDVMIDHATVKKASLGHQIDTKNRDARKQAD